MAWLDAVAVLTMIRCLDLSTQAVLRHVVYPAVGVLRIAGTLFDSFNVLNPTVLM